MATEKIIEYSRRALPFLIYCAQQRRTLTYKELADHASCHHRVTAHILGYIRDEICAPRTLPYINAIVIRQDNGLPGDAWLPEGTAHLTDTEYREQFEQFRDKVFAFSGWNELLKELSLPPMELSEQDLKERGRTYSQVLARQVSGGEGEAHRSLKEFVACHPEAIGLPSSPIAQTEYLFISGDCCDVLFRYQHNQFAIAEIKNGDPGELTRGIYQLIKYRALLIAEEDLPAADLPSLHLVAYHIDPEVEQLAAKFIIHCHKIAAIPETKTLKQVD